MRLAVFSVTILKRKILCGLYVKVGVAWELLSNLVFEACRSCGDLVWGCGFNSVFEPDAGDDFGEVVKAA